MKTLPNIKQYTVKEIFGPTIQGEGSLTGEVTLFVRFAGCNMWNGKPEDREASRCPFCDTDFFGGDKMDAQQIVDRLNDLKPYDGCWVTLSGGEPLLQVDLGLLRLLKDAGFLVAIETNGTKALTAEMRDLINQVTCSPKVPANEVKLQDFLVDDLKVLYPHPNPAITPESFMAFGSARYLQPVNDIDDINTENLTKCLNKLMTLPKWKISIQSHKVMGVA